ncbi:hypothetical protein CEXT_507591 [Caerostris extrusa]|uniref:Craniofacial development protein 1 n=1 Tax=Caerostris extrusa TaxID=172846 RepID=A0AAV4URJ7_CAEEX|nr:hypothetical protein CEXT_507591 [Caerostris extrusa]
MTSIFDVSVSSDSEDDVDYVPPEIEANSESSCEDSDHFSDSDNLNVKPKKAKKTKRGNSNTEEDDKKIENTKNSPLIDEKKRVEDLWSSFLSDVSETETVALKKASPTVSTDTPKTDVDNRKNESMKSEKVPISKVFEFAGETYTLKNDASTPVVTKEEEIEPSKSSENSLDVPKKRAGLDSVLGTIRNKKQKVTVLQKSLHDWNTFKKSEVLQKT